jgi:hypothetical protein
VRFGHKHTLLAHPVFPGDETAFLEPGPAQSITGR